MEPVFDFTGMSVEFKQTFSVANDDDPVVRLGDRPVLLGRMILAGEVSMKDTVEFAAEDGELKARVVR